MSDRVRVLLAEPDAPTRMGMRLALEAEGFEVRCETMDARSATIDSARERPQVCLIDEGLPGGALVAVDAIFRAVPETKLLALTDSEEPRSFLAAIRTGAVGDLRKDLDPTRPGCRRRSAACSTARRRCRGV